MTLRRATASVLAMLLLCACAEAQHDAASLALSGVTVLVRADSGGEPTLEVESLRYPHQVPWHGAFYVSVELEPSVRCETVTQVGFDVWMGPQVFGGPDGEVLVKADADRLGRWFRSTVTAEETCGGQRDCPHRILLGPFELADVVPGPRGAEASLWPTRLRVSVQVFAAGVLVRDVRRARIEKVMPIN